MHLRLKLELLMVYFKDCKIGEEPADYGHIQIRNKIRCLKVCSSNDGFDLKTKRNEY
jgi:hypothetical protein